jgi:hypothetical protein
MRRLTGIAPPIRTQRGRCRAICSRRRDIEIKFANGPHKTNAGVAFYSDSRVWTHSTFTAGDNQAIARKQLTRLLKAIPGLTSGL